MATNQSQGCNVSVGKIHRGAKQIRCMRIDDPASVVIQFNNDHTF
jgi:hypothetical protein